MATLTIADAIEADKTIAVVKADITAQKGDSIDRLPARRIRWLPTRFSEWNLPPLVIRALARSFARHIGLEPRTTPLESPQSNGMAEAFVRTIKRDHVRVSPRPDAETVMRQLPTWIAHHNEVHPHKALGYRSPREFIAAHARP